MLFEKRNLVRKIILRTLRIKYNKFISTYAIRMLIAEGLNNSLRDNHESLVALKMTAQIVKLLKTVHVDIDNAESGLGEAGE